MHAHTGRSISPTTLNRWVIDLGLAAKSPLEVSRELAPKGWGGFLGIDGKYLSISGEENVLLIAVDHPSQDLVHALLLPGETKEGFTRLETEVIRDVGYPIRGVTCDFARGWAEAHRDHFGRVPFQACRVHFDRRLEQDIPKARGAPDAPLRAELKERIRSVLYAPTEELARELLDQLLAEGVFIHKLGRGDPLKSLARHFSLYMTHHRVPGVPPDNNVVENVVKYLEKKLRLMEGFASLESAEATIRLIIGCYRFKRFTDSSKADHNGRAPLEVAGADLTGMDWLSFLLSPRPDHHGWTH